MYNTCVVNSNFKGDTFKSENDFGKRQAKKAHFVSCFINNTKIKVAVSLDDETEYLLHYIPNIEPSIITSKSISLINAQNSIFNSQKNIDDLLNKYGKNFILIDRIHENKNATKNWQMLKNSDTITISINFYHFALISTNKDFTKQDFVLRF